MYFLQPVKPNNITCKILIICRRSAVHAGLAPHMLKLEQFRGPFRGFQDLKKVGVHGRVRSRETLGAIRSPLARPSPAASATTLIERLWAALETRRERVGGTTCRELIHCESFRASLLQPSKIIGLLTRRSERTSLDNAFALIVGTRTNSDLRGPNWFKLRTSRVRPDLIANLGER